MEPARSESCPSGQRRGLAATGEDTITSPYQKRLHTSTIQQPGDDNSDPRIDTGMRDA